MTTLETKTVKDITSINQFQQSLNQEHGVEVEQLRVLGNFANQDNKLFATLSKEQKDLILLRYAYMKAMTEVEDEIIKRFPKHSVSKPVTT